VIARDTRPGPAARSADRFTGSPTLEISGCGILFGVTCSLSITGLRRGGEAGRQRRKALFSRAREEPGSPLLPAARRRLPRVVGRRARVQLIIIPGLMLITPRGPDNNVRGLRRRWPTWKNRASMRSIVRRSRRRCRRRRRRRDRSRSRSRSRSTYAPARPPLAASLLALVLLQLSAAIMLLGSRRDVMPPIGLHEVARW